MTAFREAMDLLCLSAGEVAKLLDVAPQTVRQMRLDPAHVNYRRPPNAWQAVFAPLADQRGGELRELAAELRKAAGE